MEHSHNCSETGYTHIDCVENSFILRFDFDKIGKSKGRIMGILSYMMAFGLAAGAGSRACMVLFALGAFHYTPYFELSESYAWVASIPVMFVIGFLTLLDILADLNPNISELNDVAQYLPGLVAGFLCFAAMTGSVDSNLLHLVISGVLGGGVATGARFVRKWIV